MTNFEKYKKELLDITEGNSGVALVKGNPVKCKGTSCTDCDWGKVRCSTAFVKWLYSEEPQIDWSKVKVDTPILVSDDGKYWRERHFARFCDGSIHAWRSGCTSWTESRTCPWTYAKLKKDQ